MGPITEAKVEDLGSLFVEEDVEEDPTLDKENMALVLSEKDVKEPMKTMSIKQDGKDRKVRIDLREKGQEGEEGSSSTGIRGLVVQFLRKWLRLFGKMDSVFG